jgi:nucleotide-binding universal stress UspA family protein
MVILAAVSESEQSREIALEADALAAAFDDEVHLIHVTDESEYTRTVERQSESRQEGSGDVAEAAAAEAVEDFLDELDAETKVVSRIGTPGKKIVEYAGEVDARYLVIGGRSRSPVGKALFGSVTQSVLLNTERPVVTITASD